MDGNEKAQHNREAFQLERLMLFTDAVFAIAITLLAIEIKVSELHHATEQAVLSHPDLDLDLIRPMLSPMVFLLSIGLALLPFIAPWLLRMTPMLLFPAFVLYQRRYQRLQREYKQPSEAQLA